MSETLRVLVLLEVIGLATLPIVARVLGRLPGSGLGFEKPLGLLIVGWIVFIAGSVGVPNGLPLAIGALVALVLAGAVAHRFGKPLEPDPVRPQHLLAAEVTFVVSFLAFALFLAFSPDVWGTEKPMDMAFVNATIASESFPPHDPWFAGETLDYYYFGHLMAGVIIRLTGVEPTAGYNLGLAAVFALTTTGAMTLGAAVGEAARRRGMPIKQPLLAGAGAVLLLVLLSNLRGFDKALEHVGSFRTFDWFAPSRVISYTINEWPFFSLLVQDLHAHVIALPFTLLAVAFAVQVALSGTPRGADARSLTELFCAALATGALYAINAWSWPISVGLLFLAVIAWLRDPASIGRRRSTVVWTGTAVAVGALMFLPFIIGFEPNTRGVGIVPTRESFWDFARHNVGLYGTLLWLVLALYGARARALRRPLRVAILGAAAFMLVASLAMRANLIGAAIVAVLLLIALHALIGKGVDGPERVLWIFVAGGMACLLGPEIVYVRDPFAGGEFFRMNTVFKIGYHTWILLALAGGVALVCAHAWLPRAVASAWRVGAVVLIAAGLYHSYIAAYARKDAYSAWGSLRIDGRAWLERSAPGDVAAVEWLRDNSPGDAVVLEAVADDFTAFSYARISTYTGRPTVLGSVGHEQQWGHDPGARRDEVRKIYTSKNVDVACALLERHRVAYAVVGPFERERYGEAPALGQLGRKVFDRRGTAIYMLPFGRERAATVAGSKGRGECLSRWK